MTPPVPFAVPVVVVPLSEPVILLFPTFGVSPPVAAVPVVPVVVPILPMPVALGACANATEVAKPSAAINNAFRMKSILLFNGPQASFGG